MLRRALGPLCLVVLAGCSGGEEQSPDLGDSGDFEASADGASVDTDVDSGSTDDSATADTGSSDTDPTDTAVADTAAADSTVTDTAAVDSALGDSAVADSAVADTPITDSTATDSAVADTGVAVADTGVAVTDTSVTDTFVTDTAVADTAVSDTTSSDTGSADSGSTDTGGDSGVLSCSGAGFTATAASFALPTSYAGAWFYDLSGSTSCGSTYSRPAYQVFDIDGDGKEDLVVTNTCDSATTVGKTRWVVHKNIGTGFAAVGVDWALPTGYSGAWFYTLSGSTSCGSTYSRPAYQVFDIDGDGKQDLVVTDTCDSATTVGKSRWIVHKNTGTGFANAGVDWALPTGYSGAWYYDLSGSTSCGSTYSRPAYQVFDIDGDGKQDFVVTDTCDAATTVGKTRWVVHKNTGAAFVNAGVDWALPTGYTGAWYYTLSGSTSCGSTYSRPAYEVFDIDGDGKQDLVVTDTCDSGTTVGKTRWVVHTNTGAAFASVGVDWALPTAYTGAWFYTLSGSTSCGSTYSRPAYQVFDLDNDGKRDLVVTDTCDSASTVGRDHWLLHKNTGTGFAAASTSWCLPTSYKGAWFYDLSGSTSCGSTYSRPAYQVLDLDGDHALDLVVTDTCDTGTTVGKTQWLVH